MAKFIGSTNLTYLWGKIKAYISSKHYAGSTTDGGTANRAASIPFAYVDSTSTSTVYTATVPGITSLTDGVCCYLVNDVVKSATGFTINVNNLGALPAYSTQAAATQLTSGFSKGYTYLFVYNSTRVEGGCWDCYYGYSSSIGYQIRTNSSTKPTKSKFYRYRILFSSPDGTKWIPSNTSSSTNATGSRTVNQDKIDPWGDIRYYSTTTAVEANANPSASYLYQQSTLTLGYSFNRTGVALELTYPAPVYIKCAPQTDGSAIMDSTTPYVQALPSTADGKIYIFLGIAYSATAVEMLIAHPVYHYKNGAIRLWTNADIPTKVSDLTNDSGFITSTSAESTYSKLPLVIEVDDTDETVPSGTYDSITTALAAGRKVYVKVVCTDVGQEGDVQYYILPLSEKYDVEGDEQAYFFSLSEYSFSITASIHHNDTFSFQFKYFSEVGHYHGNIKSDGKLQISDITIANGDKLVVTDTSNNSEIARASVAFDGSTTTQALSKKGTWETFYQKPSTGIPSSDLASGVQTSLGKADTALQSFTETDPVFSSSAAHGISSSDITNWNGKVGSTDVTTIVKLTQSAYDALASVDSNTLYLIVES